MISTKVSAVCRLRDGYTGKTLAPANAVCHVDGVSIRPVIKPEGYLVFTDLPAGIHELSVQTARYREESVKLEIGDIPAEFDLVLKPGEGYPLPTCAARLCLTLMKKRTPAANETLWLAAPAAAELKIAQTQAEIGDTAFRIFCRGAAQVLPVPGTYLIADGENSEIIRLKAMTAEQGILSAPLEKPHGRGCLLLPAQHYRTDKNGCIEAVFPTDGKIEVWLPKRNILNHIELSAGENRLKI